MIYLLIAKAIVVDTSAHFTPTPSLALAPRVTLSWLDPALVLYLADSVALAPTIPAILTILVLGPLVGVNGAMALETIARRPPACGRGRAPWWAFAVLPSLLATFSCCAPTIVLLIGAGVAGAVISVIPFVVPAAAVLLLTSILWSARRLDHDTVLASV